MQAVRGEAEVAANGTLKPKDHAPSHIESASKCGENDAQRNDGSIKGGGPPGALQQPATSRSPFRFQQAKAAPSQCPQDPGYKHPDGETTPAYTIVHQGTHDLADAWSDSKVPAHTLAVLAHT